MYDKSTMDLDENIKKTIQDLTKLDNWHSVFYLAIDYTIIASMIALCINISFWFYPMAWLVIGSRQRGLANLLHAAVHRTLAKNTTWNFISGSFLSGYLIGQQFVRYNYSHVVNHLGKFGDSEYDPDYRQHISLGLYKTTLKREYLIKNVYRALLGLHIPKYINHVIKARLWGGVPEKYNNRIISQGLDQIFFFALWGIIISLAWYQDVFKLLLIFWFFPLFTSAMIIGWFIELAEHYPLMKPGIKPIQATRNRHGGWLERLLTGVHNDHYHLEHHLNPKVPMWNLPTSNHVRLAESNYRVWDNQWGGIFSNKDALASRRTVMQYILSPENGVISLDQKTGAQNYVS